MNAVQSRQYTRTVRVMITVNLRTPEEDARDFEAWEDERVRP